MKNGVCRVCDHNRVIVLDRFIKTKWDEALTPEEITEAEAEGRELWRIHSEEICLQAFVCRSCGYTELYTPKPEPSAIRLKEGKYRELRGPEA